MSLLRFLVVGSSLKGVKDRPSPYKMTQQHLLPKFGSSKEAEPKSAAVLTVTPDQDDAQDDSVGVSVGAIAPPSVEWAPRPTAVAHGEAEGTKMNVVEADAKAEVFREQGVVVGQEQSEGTPGLEGPGAQNHGQAGRPPHDRWSGENGSRLAPKAGLIARLSRYVFQRLGRNPSQPKTAGRKGTAPIQGELLLEGVKVVRNDLNETDLEVVTATKSPEAAIVPAQPGVGGESARVAWRRMATRLFGSRRT